MTYLLSIPLAIPAIAIISLVFLFVDIYPGVKSFIGMLRTPSFLLFWLVSFMLTTVAYFFLMTTSLIKIQGLVGVEATKLTAILLASLRTQVLEDITKKNSQIERLNAFNIADQLSDKFRDDEKGIMEEYSQ